MGWTRPWSTTTSFVRPTDSISPTGFPSSNPAAYSFPPEGEPAILGGPESEPFALSDAAIKKTYNVPVFMVPDEEYPSARILSLREVFAEALGDRALRRLGIVGLGVMPHALYVDLTPATHGVELVDITEPFEQLRWSQERRRDRDDP